MSEQIVLPLTSLIILSFISRVTLQSFAAPGAFFPLAWACLTTVSIIAAPDYPVAAGGLWWITLSLLLFFAGNTLAQLLWRRRQPISPASESQQPHLEGLRLLIVASIIAGSAYTLFYDKITAGSHDAVPTPPLYFQPLLAGYYIGPMFGGMMVGAQQRRAVAWALAACLPIVVWSLLGAGRSGLASTATYFFGGFLPMRCLMMRGRVPLFGPRHLVSYAVVLSVIVGLSILATNFRQYVDMGRQDLAERAQLFREETRIDRVEDSWIALRHGVFGHVYAFSYWFNRAYDAPPKPLWGLHLLAGPLDLFGLKAREPAENFSIEPGIDSNVYTLFKIAIDDWGFTGSLIVFFLMGILTGFAYEKVSQGGYMPQIILCIYYTYVISIGGHVLAYNSLLLSFAVCGSYLAWIGRRSRPAPRLEPEAQPA